MPKFIADRIRDGPRYDPYGRSVGSRSKSTNNIFKMKTDIGQHVLKNPGVAQAIVDKAGLRQSDVRANRGCSKKA